MYRVACTHLIQLRLVFGLEHRRGDVEAALGSTFTEGGKGRVDATRYVAHSGRALVRWCLGEGVSPDMDAQLHLVGVERA